MEVVVIEDTQELGTVVKIALEADGMSVHLAGDAETGLELVRSVVAEVVVMDIQLPGMDGFEACRRLRTFSDAYVVMLTGRVSENDRLAGLAVGADDYMTKPFYARELVARIRAMQRRPRSARGADHRREFGALAIDPDVQEVTMDGSIVELSRTEYQVLDALSVEPDVSLSRAQLLERVWGTNWFGDDHVIDVHVSNLRRKLGDDPRRPRYVRTVRGFGYRMGAG
jgi:DNA-binding response OmpR family regulator